MKHSKDTTDNIKSMLNTSVGTSRDPIQVELYAYKLQKLQIDSTTCRYKASFHLIFFHLFDIYPSLYQR